MRYFEKGLSKSLKKVNFIFSFEPSPFYGQSYQNEKRLELVPSHSPGHETSSEKFLYLLYII